MTSGIFEPYVQVEFAKLLISSDVATRSRHLEQDHGWALPLATGLDVYVSNWLRTGSWFAVAPLYIVSVQGGNAVLNSGPDLPPTPVFRTIWSTGLALTVLIDRGREEPDRRKVP